MQPRKVPLASMPVVEASRRLTRCLTPDPVVKDPSNFLKLLQGAPSLQRRARLLAPRAHFSYVSPLPLPFPFRVEFPEEVEDKKQFIESWLIHREATEPAERAMPLEAESPSEGLVLTKYTAKDRIQERELLGVVPQCVTDCFPRLDIGDAVEYIGRPSLTADRCDDASNAAVSSSGEGGVQVKARQELLDILSGHTMLASFPSASPPSDDEAYAPWSLRYSGHQFGQWAGQLGDGRAISICAFSCYVSSKVILKGFCSGSAESG